MNNRVYFMQAKNGGPIKLGATKDLAERVRALGNLVPGGMEIIVSIPGHQRRESYLKAALAPWSVHSEWFRNCASIWRVMLEAIETGDLAWVPADRPYGREEWVETFNRNAATPGFKCGPEQGWVGVQRFGRAEFAADLHIGRLPAWLALAHGEMSDSTLNEASA